VGGRRFAFEKQWISGESEKARDELPQLQESRQSDICVIVGNGPSLMRTDFSLLKDQAIFVSNNTFINEKLIESAKYYAVTNYLVAQQGYWHINSLQHIYRFSPWFLGYCLNSDEKAFFLNAVGDTEFSTDILERISWKSTVSFFMMQIAYSLGYRKVVLVGFDHNYTQPKSMKEGTLIYQDQDDPNHFDPSYFRGKRWQAADVGNMEEVYWLAKRAFEEDGREIINATVGGHLEVFRRDSLENALLCKTCEQGATMKRSTPPHDSSISSRRYTRDDHAHTEGKGLRDKGLYHRLIDYLKIHYPIIITIGRFGKWSLTKLKRNLFGVGGIFLFIIALYVIGALVEPARWYLVGIASALLLSGGGLLALSYARSVLNRIVSDQRRQLSDINKQVTEINRQASNIKKEVAPYEEIDRLRIERIESIERQVEMDELQNDVRDSKPILFFNATSGPRSLSFASTAGLIISWALRLSGHRVIHLVCRNGLRRCIQGTNRHEIDQAMPCEKCYAIRSKMFPQDLCCYLESKSGFPEKD